MKISPLSQETKTIAPPNIFPLFARYQRLATGQELTQAIQVYLPTMCPEYMLCTCLCRSHHFTCVVERTPAHPEEVPSPTGPSQTHTHLCCHPQITQAVVTRAHLATRTPPNNPYNHITPYATTINTQNKQLNTPQFIPKMPKICGTVHKTLMVTSSLMHPSTYPNSNT